MFCRNAGLNCVTYAASHNGLFHVGVRLHSCGLVTSETTGGTAWSTKSSAIIHAVSQRTLKLSES